MNRSRRVQSEYAASMLLTGITVCATLTKEGMSSGLGRNFDVIEVANGFLTVSHANVRGLKPFLRNWRRGSVALAEQAIRR